MAKLSVIYYKPRGYIETARLLCCLLYQSYIAVLHYVLRNTLVPMLKICAYWFNDYGTKVTSNYAQVIVGSQQSSKSNSLTQVIVGSQLSSKSNSLTQVIVGSHLSSKSNSLTLVIVGSQQSSKSNSHTQVIVRSQLSSTRSFMCRGLLIKDNAIQLFMVKFIFTMCIMYSSPLGGVTLA